MTDRHETSEPKREQKPLEHPERSLSMHEGIAVWCDCCSCEAEERWVEVGEKMGIDMSDYEKEAPEEEEKRPERH